MVHAVETATESFIDPVEAAAVQQVLLAYFVPAAEHLRNDTGLPISSARPAPPAG
jgi:hemoglobin